MSTATVAPPSTAVSVVLADVIKERWLAALRTSQPGLPQPVAVAMVEAAAKGNLGIELRKIEQALMSFESTGLEDLTGSEARVLIAILRQMSGELAQLESQLNSLWEQK
jgi:predicted metal-dependent TIM-barrel fold hydrolase